MAIRLLTITHKAKPWIHQGFNEYAQRLSAPYNLELIEIPPCKAKGDAKVMMEQESHKLLAAMRSDHIIVALDRTGKAFSTEEFAQKLAAWLSRGQTIDLLVGGADGLHASCIKQAEVKWSLSPLTFPHQLVRILIAEQIYRAYTLTKNHPYHR
ncbi:MAG: 23S rRNA (pseudouridine(1915)-N(3))-methyltransferase RlmH [Gammaproteobacteria bacterium]|nr:23S rRNA (pseudouridine(1915)-N(3))-methyltransferase RlmH [Gammaproteobacteria bacterium]